MEIKFTVTIRDEVVVNDSAIIRNDQNWKVELMNIIDELFVRYGTWATVQTTLTPTAN